MDVLSSPVTDSKGFLIPYEYLYKNVFENVKPLFYILLVIWIIALFYSMYSIADRHFTWALEHLSLLCRLSPDMAGLTFLAFGNGAPDFFTAVFGADEEPEMILGSSLGSGLFIITIVFGLVILFAKRPGSGRSLVLPNGETQEITSQLNQEFFDCSPMVKHQINPVSFLRSALMYLFCVALLSVLLIIKEIPFWLPLLLVGIYFIYLGSVIAINYHGRRASKSSRATTTTTSTTSLIVKGKTSLQEQHEKLMNEFLKQSFPSKILFSLKQTCWGEKPESASIAGKVWWAFSGTIKAPISLLLNMTIIPMEVLGGDSLSDPENYVSLRFLHRIRCVLNPYFSLLLYIFLLVGPSSIQSIPWYTWMIYGFSSTGLSLLLWLTTSWTESPKFFPIHMIHAFCTCILWIYATSSELVSCLSSTGSLLGVSPTVMGILVLAWGNSFGDLVADVTVAKNGSFETAVTAIFSGPVQNILLTIGVGFLIAALRQDNLKVVVAVNSLRLDVYLALFFLVITLIASLIVVSVVFDFQIPRNFGFLLLTIYMIYLPFALLTGLGLLELPFF